MVVREEMLKTKQKNPNPSWDFLLCMCIISGYRGSFPMKFGFV